MPSPVISVSQMRDWEKASWVAGKIESRVIARVGEIVAFRVRQMARSGDSILLLAGKGHNGDDTRQTKKYLHDFQVELCEVTDPAKATAKIRAALLRKPSLIVDGLFGIGLNRPLDLKWQLLLQQINEAKIPILSVDVPSGLNADTGKPEGAAIRASVTLTLGAAKRGMLLPPAWPYTGRLEVAADIGLVPCPCTSDTNWTLPEDFQHFPPSRDAIANKGDFGHLAILAGSPGYHGAAVLTARGAQRARPGLITVHAVKEVYPVIASQLQAVMVHVWRPDLKLPGKYKALLIGPGLAAEDLPKKIKTTAQALWHTAPIPMVVDASALDWLQPGATLKGALRVVTPHPGEAGRMLGIPTREVQSDRPQALRRISRKFGNCWVVLKGAQTLIGRTSGELRVNSSGNPGLAQGGSGDVLSGYLAGLLAQSALQADPLTTLAYGVWQHGATADHLSQVQPNWVVERRRGDRQYPSKIN